MAWALILDLPDSAAEKTRLFCRQVTTIVAPLNAVSMVRSKDRSQPSEEQITFFYRSYYRESRTRKWLRLCTRVVSCRVPFHWLGSFSSPGDRLSRRKKPDGLRDSSNR